MATFYVSTTGTSGNSGTLGSPWSAAHALSSGNTTLQPGDVVRWRPGTYDLGTLTATKAGTANAPIVHVRDVGTEWTSIEGSVLCSGAHVWFQDFDLCWSGTEARGPVPDETALVRWGKNVTPNADSIRWIQCRVHDMKDGVFAGNTATNLVLDECYFYNQGVDGNTRGHGHGIYLQNDTGTKRVRNCMVWGGYQFGMQLFGSSLASIRNIVTEDCALFDCGVSTSYEAGGEAALIVNGGTSGTLGPNLTWDRCSLWRTNTATGTVLRLGLDGFGTGFAFRNSHVRGYAEIAPNLGTTFTDNLVWSEDWNSTISRQIITAAVPGGQPDSVYTIDRNQYHLRSPLGRTFDLAAWRARGYDINGNRVTTNPTGVFVRAIPSRYTAGRGHVHVWNYGGASSVTVDIGAAVHGLTGFPYAIYHAFDFVTGGGPIATGTYDGTLVTIPMDARTPPRPYGATVDPPTMPNTFGAFVVTQRPGWTVNYRRGI